MSPAGHPAVAGAHWIVCSHSKPTVRQNPKFETTGMENRLQINGRLLTRNWALNLAGQGLPLLVALATLRFVIAGLGSERFGILSMAWVLLGAMGAFDMGLGRATTKFVAECLARGEAEQLAGLLWTSLLSQVGLGVVAALLLARLVPVLVTRWLRISPAVRGDAKTTFLILAGLIPVVLAANTLRGALEATQRFGVVNCVKLPLNVSVFLLPAIVLPWGLGLPGIVGLLGATWVAAALAYFAGCCKFLPGVGRIVWKRKTLRPLLVYGGWVSISNALSPLMSYIDRIVIASLVSMAAVGYYAVPYDAMNRAWIIPGSLTSTLFPAFSALTARGSSQRAGEICARSLKSLLLVLGPLLLLVIGSARLLLQFWLGAEFAEKSSLVLQILAAGALFNSLGVLPCSFLQGIGRPDLTAKLHLAELPFYLLTMWWMVGRWGIVGAALAWSMRVFVDAALLFGTAFWLRFVSLQSFTGNRIQQTIAAVATFGLLLLFPLALGSSALTQVVVAGLLLPAFAVFAWSFLLDGGDRGLLIATAVQARNALWRSGSCLP